MDVNVFGTPVTTSYVERMEEYRHSAPITQYDRAKVAMEQKNADGKDVSAKKMVKQLRQEFGSDCDNESFTMCLIYNATGNPVMLHDARNWDGLAIGSLWPMIIANGQWGASLFNGRKRNVTGGSASFIYEGNNFYGKPVHWVTAFDTSLGYKSTVFTEIRPPTYYLSSLSNDSSEWSAFKDKLKSTNSCNYRRLNDIEGASMYASIGDSYGGVAPMLEVVLTLPGVFDY